MLSHQNFYLMTRIFTLFFILIVTGAFAQTPRITAVDPLNNTVTIKNYGSSGDISSYRFCSLFGYKNLDQTTIVSGNADLTLDTDEEVTLLIDASGSGSLSTLNANGADLGLYLPTGSFGSASAMVDFVQWKTSGNGREGVANTKGIWTSGEFISGDGPYEFSGGETDFGLSFWAQVPLTPRIIAVNPTDNTVTIKNFGTAGDISQYRFCSLIKYKDLDQATIVSGNADLTLDPLEEVTLLIDATGSGGLTSLNANGADLGLYLPTGSFGSASAMLDFVQWKTSGNGREGVANTKGIWTSGDFVAGDGSYEFSGTKEDFGVSFWSLATVTSTEREIDEEEILFFPNIISVGETLNFNERITAINVYDLKGKLIFTGNDANFNTAALTSGVYLIYSDKQTQKLVVK